MCVCGGGCLLEWLDSEKLLIGWPFTRLISYRFCFSDLVLSSCQQKSMRNCYQICPEQQYLSVVRPNTAQPRWRKKDYPY